MAIMKKVLLFFFFLCNLTSLSLQVPVDVGPDGSTALDQFPLIDGHNDLPYNLFNKLGNKIADFQFDKNLSEDSVFGTKNCSSCFTDLPRLKQGKLGAQFWVAYVGCNSQNADFVSKTIAQIDVIKRLVNKYSKDMEFVTTANGIEEAFKTKKIASLIGVEGGHSIDNQLAVLRLYYELGVRYMTLTHSCNLPWADASPVDENEISSVVNLTDFGQKVVVEMNRLGMMVDLSHVSHNVMSKAIDISKAPVIFSHSSAFSIHAHHRNVRDDVLLKVKNNRGVVMVNFYSDFVGEGNVTISDVADHINHIVKISGVDHVGIGSDYDGVTRVPDGLEDVSKYPDLFDLLKKDNPVVWTIENLGKLAGGNLLRVFKEVEKVRDELVNTLPDENLIPKSDLPSDESSENNKANNISTYSPFFIFFIMYRTFLMKV